MIQSTSSDKIPVYCSDTDKTVMAEILEFNPRKFLNVAVERSIRLTMKYDAKHDQYVGNMAKLEFTSKGPK
jgi:hypothetical protein